MKTIFLLIRREFRAFLTNRIFVVAFLLMPLVFSVVQAMVYQQGKVRHLPIIVVDKDQTPASNRFRDMLEDDPILHVISNTYETVNLHALLLQTRAVAVVVIPYHFEADLLGQKKPDLICYLNMANTLTANAAGGAINLCAGTMNAGLLQKRGVADAFRT
ncbi:ABC transporter permease, partial [Chitinophaga sp.]|uniref:ABC transporter permease n=1 Tax=Chitinophaga sp. TaxID=1869181 RepID=UPI0031E03949